MEMQGLIWHMLISSLGTIKKHYLSTELLVGSNKNNFKGRFHLGIIRLQWVFSKRVGNNMNIVGR